MTSEWVVVNSVVEKEDDANPEFPWYPCLFVDNGGYVTTGLDIWFSTEEECREFIKDHILGATMEEGE